MGRRTVHFLVSHPTPPVFDGPEDRNGRRNHDEIRLWADYITPRRGGYLYDDQGRRGGLRPGELFVIAGDQNADPYDGDSTAGAIRQLLDHLRVDYVLPRRGMRILGARVFWPRSSNPLFRLVGTFPFPSSDHRLVWVDVAVRGARR